MDSMGNQEKTDQSAPQDQLVKQEERGNPVVMERMEWQGNQVNKEFLGMMVREEHMEKPGQL